MGGWPRAFYQGRIKLSHVSTFLWVDKRAVCDDAGPCVSFTDVEHYIQHRWTKAGGQTHPFGREALEQITRWSTGIPRLINVLCDNALVLAFVEGSSVVAAKHVAEVASDLELSERPGRRAVAPLRVVAIGKNTNGTAKSGGGTLPTVERYIRETSNPSRLTRFAAKLRLGENRDEQDL